MIEMVGQLWDSILGVRLDGERLIDSPQQLIPQIVDLIEKHDCDRCVIEMRNLDIAAYYPFWEELSPQASGIDEVKRCAIVSEAWTEEWVKRLITPLFPSARIEWFDESRLSAAWKWATQAAMSYV